MSKSAVLPQVRVEPELRSQAEALLRPGESLSEFVERAVARAVEHRQALRDFDAECHESLLHFLATGESFSSEQVLRELRERTEKRRTELLKKA